MIFKKIQYHHSIIFTNWSSVFYLICHNRIAYDHISVISIANHVIFSCQINNCVEWIKWKFNNIMILNFGRFYAPCKNTGITQKWRIITWLSQVIKVGYGNPAIWLSFFWFDQKLKMIGTIYFSFLIIFSSMQVCTGKQLQQLQRTVEKTSGHHFINI